MSRSRGTPQRAVAAAILSLPAPPAAAHSFGQNYALPVPIWLYLYGAVAALLASFVVVAYFVTTGTRHAAPRQNKRGRSGSATVGWRWLIRVIRAASVCCLVLCITAGFVGVNDPYRNINMTLFWVVFVLGFTYLTALVGDIFAFVNPWRVIVEWLERLATHWFRGRLGLSLIHI